MAPMAKVRIYWTPARIKALKAATGAKTDAEFGVIVRVSAGLVNNWLNGQRKPQPIMELALDCIAAKYGLPTSEGKTA